MRVGRLVATDYRDLLNNTIINLRYKTNNLSTIDTNSLLLNNSGISYQPSSRFMNFSNESTNINVKTSTSTFTSVLDYLPSFNVLNNFNISFFVLTNQTTETI